MISIHKVLYVPPESVFFSQIPGAQGVKAMKLICFGRVKAEKLFHFILIPERTMQEQDLPWSNRLHLKRSLIPILRLNGKHRQERVAITKPGTRYQGWVSEWKHWVGCDYSITWQAITVTACIYCGKNVGGYVSWESWNFLNDTQPEIYHGPASPRDHLICSMHSHWIQKHMNTHNSSLEECASKWTSEVKD